jgi:uncharacterized protein (TIGR02757 family)
MMDTLSLKRTLNRFYKTFDFRKRLIHDPIMFPRKYSEPEDIEVAGFLATCFAYGKVELFKPVIDKVLRPGGKHPAGFIAGFKLKRDAKYFKDIRYRFNNETDVLCLIYMLNNVLKNFGSLKKLFLRDYRQDHEDIRSALSSFRDYFMGIDTSPVYGKNVKPISLTFFPDPKGGSACKRMNLFLRWMVRERDIDLGIWNDILPSQLIIPLDTHIARISQCLGLTSRISSDWKTAKEITESLKVLDPHDPLKYDFALCHHGISGLCRGRRGVSACKGCSLK